MGTRVFTVRRFAVLVLAGIFIMSSPGIILAQEPVKVVEVAISGNQNINTDTIMNVVNLKPGDDFSDTAVEKDQAAIMALGYFSAVTIHKDDAPGGVKVTFEVTEHPRITEIQVVGSEPVPVSKILELMKTKPGQVLNDNTVDQDLVAIQQYYGDQGYIAYVTEDYGVIPGTTSLRVPILVNTVDSIEISGNRKTKSYVLLREMKTKPGQVFNINILKEDINRIYNLDILDTENIKPYQFSPGREIGTVKITIPVVEKKTGQVGLGFGYSSQQKLVGQFRLSETNFRGKGQGLNLLWEQGTTEAVGGPSSYELGFYEPWIDKHHTSLSVTGFNKVQYRFSQGVFGNDSIADGKTYNERHQGGDLTVSRPLSDKLRVYLSGRYDDVSTAPDLLYAIVEAAAPPEGQEPDPPTIVYNELYKIAMKGPVAIGSLRAVHNTRDIDIDPAVGGYESIAVQFGTSDAIRYIPNDDPDIIERLKNPFIEVPFKGPFRKMSIDLRRYFSHGGRKSSPADLRTTFAIRATAGIASGSVPYFEQFFVGGGETLRGYREDRFWGNNMLLVSAELRKPIAQAISGVLFIDYGDAWNGNPLFFINQTDLNQHSNFQGHYGYGVGIRVNTPIGRLRLDYGIGSEGGRTHFSMGQAF